MEAQGKQWKKREEKNGKEEWENKLAGTEASVWWMKLGGITGRKPSENIGRSKVKSSNMKY